MWSIQLPDISVIYKKTEEELTDWDRKHNEKPITPAEKELRDLLTTEYNKNVNYLEYINLPKVNALLKEHPAYEPVIYACYQCEHHNFAKRKGETKNGTKAEQRTGLIAQTILADYLDQPRPDGNEGFDRGIDLKINGANVDIKCMGRTVYIEHQWVHNLIKKQVDNKESETDYYLFCSLNKVKSTLQVCGYVQKNLVKECAELIAAGTERYNDAHKKILFKDDTFEVKQDVLYPICSPEEIDKGINKDHLVKTIDERLRKDCVRYYKYAEEAKNDDVKKKYLEKYEEQRFHKIINRSTLTDMEADYEYQSKHSLDFMLSRTEGKHKEILEKYVKDKPGIKIGCDR